jgi:hypothetical protein
MRLFFVCVVILVYIFEVIVINFHSSGVSDWKFIYIDLCYLVNCCFLCETICDFLCCVASNVDTGCWMYINTVKNNDEVQQPVAC